MHNGDFHLTEDQRARLNGAGFLVIDNFVDAEEVARRRTIYDRLFASDAGRAEG